MPNGRFVPFPPRYPFPESMVDSLGVGDSDFPGSGGDREHGKFRPSKTPRLTTVAVSDDSGQPVGTAAMGDAPYMLLELRAIRIGIEQLLHYFTDEYADLIEAAWNDDF